MRYEIINGKIKAKLDDMVYPFKLTFPNKLSLNRFKSFYINDRPFYKLILIKNVDEWNEIISLLENFLHNKIPFMVYDKECSFIINKNEKFNLNMPISFGKEIPMFYDHVTDDEYKIYNGALIDYN